MMTSVPGRLAAIRVVKKNMPMSEPIYPEFFSSAEGTDTGRILDVCASLPYLPHPASVS
jgi:hypothetical protein